MTKRPDVDVEAYNLAESFLTEIRDHTEDDIWALAKVLQDACEDACREVEERSGKAAGL